MENEPNLAPCCGEVPEIKYFAGICMGGLYRAPCYEIKCAKCSNGVRVDICNLSEKGRREAKKHAIYLWNRRNANDK